MCITIPSSANVKKARQWALWQWLSATPLRLFLIGGGGFLLVALALDLVMPASPGEWRRFNLVFAVAPALMLGPLFAYLPRLLKVTPLTYVRYAALFFLLALTQLAFLFDALMGTPPGLLYLLCLGLFWGLSLWTVRGLFSFSFSGLAARARSILYLLVAIAMTGLVLAAGLYGGWLATPPAYLWIGVLPLHLFVLLLLAYLNGRSRHGSAAAP